MKKLLLIIISLALCVTVSAQQTATFTVEGIVVDETGAALVGVTLFLKDKPGVGTATDPEGKFSIKASKNNILVLSYLGYEKVEVVLTEGKKDLNIQLKPDLQQIEEVVVVGMGTQRKVSSVAAITSVNVSELQVPTTSVANLLGGRVAGVISTMSSGEPGRNIAEFWVRGIGTFGYNAGALVLIDGLEGDINTIDPSDIESFSILKDASATAVYGVRGANGVVIITTKRGVSGKLKITIRANSSISHLKRMPDYLDAYGYAGLANEAKEVRGEPLLYNPVEMEIIRKGLDPDMYPNVNWRDEILNQNSFSQNYYAAASGGGESARYFLSMTGSNQTAAYKQDKSSIYSSNVGYNTYGYRINLDLSLTKTTSLYFGSNGSLKVRNSPGVAETDYLWYAQAELTPLSYPTVYSTGQLPASGPNQLTSPYVLVNHTGRSAKQEYSGMATLMLDQDLSFLVSGLKFKIQGAYDVGSNFEERRWVMPSLYRALGRSASGELIMRETVQAQPASYWKDAAHSRKYNLESNLTFDRIIGEDHRTSALVNYQISDELRSWEATTHLNSIPARYQRLSGRVTYGFKDTYLFEGNFGISGSENFQPGRQYGFFPSVGLGWLPTGYDWVREALPWVDMFKIKATYGLVGNDRITSRRFPYLTLLSSGWSSGIFGSGTNTQFVNESITGADNLEWEKSTKMNLGITANLLRDKITFSVDIFKDQRNGIFQERQQIPEYAGLVNRPFGNVGKMYSYGSDGNGEYRGDIGKDGSFIIRANYTFSKNKIQNWEQSYQRYPYQEISGWPINIYRGYQSIGFFKDDDDVANSPRQNWGTVMPGDIKYKDVNGDGKIDGEDMVPLSNSRFPTLMYGFGGEFRYKHFTVGLMFKGTGKTDYYKVDYGEGVGYVPFRFGETGNVLSIVNDPANRWIPMDYALAHGIDPALAENPNAQFPRLQYGDNVNNRQLSDFWRGDARYLRLQEITLDYKLTSRILQHIGVSSVNLQLVANNVYVWDKVKLFDPEQAWANGRIYPIPATYYLQIYINL